MLSFWEKKFYYEKCDFAIIGAGYTGLSCAYFLKKKFPKKVISVFERGKMPSGASTKNAGFACFGSLSEVLSDLKVMPESEVFELLEMRFKGLRMIESLLGKNSIDLNFNGAHELFRKEDAKLFKDCSDQIENINQRTKDIVGDKVYEIVDKIPGKYGFKGFEHVIFNQYEGQLNPVKMIRKLMKLCTETGVKIHFNTEICELEQNKNFYLLRTNENINVSAISLVLATNGFSKKFIDLDIQPARAQVLITKPIPELSFDSCFHFDEGYYYFRSVENRVLFGGARNLDFIGETTEKMEISSKIQNKLEEILKEYILPSTKFEIEQKWAGIMGIGKSKKPILKKINDNLYCAARLGGMGVAIGILNGQKLANLID